MNQIRKKFNERSNSRLNNQLFFFLYDGLVISRVELQKKKRTAVWSVGRSCARSESRDATESPAARTAAHNSLTHTHTHIVV